MRLGGSTSGSAGPPLPGPIVLPQDETRQLFPAPLLVAVVGPACLGALAGAVLGRAGPAAAGSGALLVAGSLVVILLMVLLWGAFRIRWARAEAQWRRSARSFLLAVEMWHESERTRLAALAPAFVRPGDPAHARDLTDEAFRASALGTVGFVRLGAGTIRCRIPLLGEVRSARQTELVRRARQLERAVVSVPPSGPIGIVGPAWAAEAVVRALRLQADRSGVGDRSREPTSQPGRVGCDLVVCRARSIVLLPAGCRVIVEVERPDRAWIRAAPSPGLVGATFAPDLVGEAEIVPDQPSAIAERGDREKELEKTMPRPRAHPLFNAHVVPRVQEPRVREPRVREPPVPESFVRESAVRVPGRWEHGAPESRGRRRPAS